MNVIRNEKEAAVELGVSPKTMQRWRSVGHGPAYVRLGPRRVGYPESTLATFIADRTFDSRTAEKANRSA